MTSEFNPAVLENTLTILHRTPQLIVLISQQRSMTDDSICTMFMMDSYILNARDHNERLYM